jgi:acetylglutamate kinase
MTRVVKIGGRAQSSPDLTSRLASAWQAMPGSFCIVHGGGDEISALQQRMGLKASFVDGRRITTAEDIAIVRMVLSGLMNKRLVSSLVSAGVPAAGMSGEDAGTISATLIDPEHLGRVGRPIAVNTGLIRTLLNAGYLPVISPLAVEENGQAGDALNVNGDDAAAAIAIALSSSELLIIADVRGVLNERSQTIGQLDQNKVSDLIQAGIISRGMRAKLEAGFAALTGGVRQVRISTLDGLEDPKSGTRLTMTPSLVT